jgi:pre-peptidase
LDISNSSIPIGSGRYAVIGNSQASTSSTLQFTKTNDPTKFIDIATTGTALNLTDDGETTITTTVGNSAFPAGPVTVGNNGGILAGANLQLDYVNTALPAATLPAALLPFWDDVDSDTGNVYWEEQTVDGIETLIVQWESRPHYDNTGSGTFQLQLFESGPVLARYVYKDVDFGNSNYSFGATATIGFQSSSTTAMEFSFNDPSIFDGDVLELSFPVTRDIDEYEIDLTGKAGHHIDILLADLFGDFQFAGQTLELIGPNGSTVLTTAVPDPLVDDTLVLNYDLGILDFVVPENGVYTVRLNSDIEGDYGIVVTDSAVFDTEFNDDPEDDPIRSITQSALGHLDVDEDEDDYYKVTLAVNQTVNISTQTPADSSPLTDNSLDPELEIIGPDGTTVVASDLDSVDGKNAIVSFVVSQAGTYLIHVRATDGAGEYALQISSPPLLPGDYNQNNEIDAADYVLWRKSLGNSVPPYSGADGDGNGSVGQEDNDLWAANFGDTFPRPAGLATLAAASHSTAGFASLLGPDQSDRFAGLRSVALVNNRTASASNVSDDALLAWLAASGSSNALLDTAFADDSAADLATSDAGSSADSLDLALDLLAESDF